MASTSLPVRRHNGAAIRAFRIKAGLKPGQFANAGGVAEVILHEQFHGTAACGIGIAHAFGNLDLHIEG